LDRDKQGGGLLLYVRQGIPSKLVLKDKNYEAIFIEVNLKKQKWLLGCSYNPHVDNINSHLELLQNSLDSIGDHDRLLLLGDFNCEIDKHKMPEFLASRELSSLINEPTCFKNAENPKCIDLMLTNYQRSFQGSSSVSNSLSDFHNITISVLKTTFEKCPPKAIIYRCYKNLNEDLFKNHLTQILESNRNFEHKMKSVVNLLNAEAPIKTKILRGNDKPFMTKSLRKAMMHRSRLNNIKRKDPSNINKYNYNQQRNRCLYLLRNTKRRFYESLDEKQITDNKIFWKTVRPFFSNKGPISEKITLVENDELIKDDKEIGKMFNEFFINITEKLDLNQPPTEPVPLNELSDNILQNEIMLFRNHPSILKIKEKVSNNENSFKFRNTTEDEVEKIISNLKTNKSQAENDIPAKIIKKYSHLFASCFSISINDSFSSGIFPNISKFATVTPVYKKNSKNDKSNYRPISILPVISKIYERVYHNQISEYFEHYFDEQQCGFRKGYSTQTSLLPMEELWKLANDKKMFLGHCSSTFLRPLTACATNYL